MHPLDAFATWLNTIDAATRPSVVTAIAVVSSGTVSALIALFGYIFTGYNTRRITAATGNLTRELKDAELRHSGRTKIADARVDWIELFRADAAELYATLYERSSREQEYRKLLVKNSSLVEEEAKALRAVYLNLSTTSSRLKSKLLMRIDPASTVPDEIALDKLLRSKTSSDFAEAREQRVLLRRLTRSILNAEWKKAKAEIEQN